MEVHQTIVIAIMNIIMVIIARLIITTIGTIIGEEVTTKEEEIAIIGVDVTIMAREGISEKDTLLGLIN